MGIDGEIDDGTAEMNDGGFQLREHIRLALIGTRRGRPNASDPFQELSNSWVGNRLMLLGLTRHLHQLLRSQTLKQQCHRGPGFASSEHICFRGVVI